MYPTNVLKIFWSRNQMFKILTSSQVIENGRLEYAIDCFAFEDEDTLRDIHFT